jgi:predicted DNA-binding transcriptional regulator AlpA
MSDRMTLIDIARYMDVSRPTAYRVVEAVGFPARGEDKRWDRDDVVDWLDRHAARGASVVGGVLVKSG